MQIAFAELPYFNDPDFIKGGRSAKSFAFEVLWRSALPKRSLPRRDGFLAENAAALLDDIVVVDKREGKRGIVMQAGASILAETGPGFIGSDYLDLMPAAHRKSAWWTLGAMASRPCGLWQLVPVHDGHGPARIIEMTAFPLYDEEMKRPVVCGYLLPCALMKGSQSTSQLVLDAPITHKFLDVGAGIPAF